VYHIAIFLVIVDCTLMACYHLFCPVPQLFLLWDSINLARPMRMCAAASSRTCSALLCSRCNFSCLQ